MEYTKQQHEKSKARIQTLLENLISLTEINNLDAGSNMLLFAKTDDGGEIEISQTAPHNKTAFFTLAWTNGADVREFLNLQYLVDTNEVSDSAEFDANGVYLEAGHIQCWHHHYGEEDVFIDNLTSLVQSLQGKLKLDAYSNNRLLHRDD